MVDGEKRKRFVLLVEDDDRFRWVVARNLQAAGYMVFQAASLREAADKIEVKPQLMVLDIELPDGTGWEVAKWLEGITSSVPIIMMSGYTEPSPRQLKQFEPKAFLAKPFPIQDLMRLVDQYA